MHTQQSTQALEADPRMARRRAVRQARVYLAQSGDLVKIGRATKPESRLRALNGAGYTTGDLRLVCSWPTTNAQGLESILRAFLYPHWQKQIGGLTSAPRCIGPVELFRCSPLAVIEVVEAIRADPVLNAYLPIGCPTFAGRAARLPK